MEADLQARPEPLTSSPRQMWLRELALGDPSLLCELAEEFFADNNVEVKLVKGPETGLCLVPGRVGGSGSAFGIGEATVSRCVVEHHDTRGVGYVLGRDTAHAYVVAVADAVLQSPLHDSFYAAVVDPIASKRKSKDAESSAEVSKTKVDFYTLAREL